MTELIGGTPLVRLSHIRAGEARLYGKLELWNPSGSVKDRVGRAMLDDAERRGILSPGGTVIDATAGNTGLGVAMAALHRGYRLIFVMPDKFSEEKAALLRALGATVLRTPREGGMRLAREEAERLRRETPGAVSLDQFTNPANPEVHYETTGPEIYADLGGQVDVFVAGAGSGGSFSGVARYLKEKNPRTRAVLADPVGSIIGGGEHDDYNIEGIGNDFIPETMDLSLIDEVVKVTDREALSGARELAAREGILAGSSSGAALAAAKKLRSPRGNVVLLLPDRGDRYFSTGLYA